MLQIDKDLMIIRWMATIRFKHENKLLQSLKTNGFLADDILALSCIIDTKRSFTDSIKKLVKKFRNG